MTVRTAARTMRTAQAGAVLGIAYATTLLAAGAIMIVAVPATLAIAAIRMRMRSARQDARTR